MSDKIFFTSILVILFLSFIAKTEIITDEDAQEYGGAIIIISLIVAFISGLWSIWS